jgi:polyhydroxybutyrate depolymerase
MKKKKLIILVVFIALSSFLHFSFLNISPGLHKDSLVINGLKRTFLYNIPESFVIHKPVPLLIVLHGGGGTGRNMVKLTMEGFNTLSEKRGFIVVYPDGIAKHWNDGRNSEEPGAKKENIDDVGFISALIDYLVKKLNVDQKRVFVTGMSNGAIMSYRLACELSEKIAAIAPVAGNIAQNMLVKCSPSRPVSILAINGTKDPLVPFNGGDVTGPFGQKKLGKVLPVQESVRFWVNINNCSTTPVVTYEPDLDIEDETLVRKESYTNGRENSEVVLYIIEDGGHTWPGGFQYLGKGIVGKTCYDINADEIIWKFFEKHSLK